MSSAIHKTPNSTNKQSFFFNDISTPLTNHRTTNPTTTPAVNSATSDLPPPPIFTLQDRSDFSPESGFQDFRVGSPVHNNSNPSPVVTSGWCPAGWKNECDDKEKTLGSGLGSGPCLGSGLGSGSGPGLGMGSGLESGVVSPVDGVVQRQSLGVLLTLPPPREVARLEVQRNSVAAVCSVDEEEEEWVTVYGFSPADTSLVLREFEKCGVLLKHVPGPKDSNWMHVLYQVHGQNGAINAPSAGGTIAVPAKSMVSKVVDFMSGS